MNVKAFIEDKNLNVLLEKELSNRELETLKAIALGFDIAEIAKNLKISRNTVKVYLNNLSYKIAIPTTKTNFRVAMSIFYNQFKEVLDATCVDKGAASSKNLQASSDKNRARLKEDDHKGSEV